MPKTTRKEIFDKAAKKLREDFAELSVIPHKGLSGQGREKLIRDFLRDRLPSRFDVGSGVILDRFNEISKQTDVVIYDAFNCPLYRAAEDSAILKITFH